MVKKLRKKAFWWGFGLGSSVPVFLLGILALFSEEALQAFLTASTCEQIGSILTIFTINGVLWGWMSSEMYRDACDWW